MKSAKAESTRRAIETLVSPQTTFQDKQAAEAVGGRGPLDEAMDARKGRGGKPAVEYLDRDGVKWACKRRIVLSRSGGSVNQMGMVGMQADQNFDDALKLDPSNWEAKDTRPPDVIPASAGIEQGAGGHPTVIKPY